MSSAAAESQTGHIENYELSKRFYYGGFIGLPWLWIVHVLHWYGKKKDVVRPDQTGTSVMSLGHVGDEMWLLMWTAFFVSFATFAEQQLPQLRQPHIQLTLLSIYPFILPNQFTYQQQQHNNKYFFSLCTQPKKLKIFGLNMHG
jgi:hypothetical protein